MDNKLNKFKIDGEDYEPVELQPITNRDKVCVDGTEHISLEFNGIKLSLGSSRIGVDELCELAYVFYDKLKQPTKKEGGSYYG